MTDNAQQVADKAASMVGVEDSGGLVVNGVDLRDLEVAHAQRPQLARWQRVSMRLIPDIYEELEKMIAVCQRQGERIEELEAEIARRDKRRRKKSK